MTCRVAIDVTQANDPRRTGIGRVVEEMLHSIAWLLERGRWPAAPPTLLSAWPFRWAGDLEERLKIAGVRCEVLPAHSMYVYRATRLAAWTLRQRPDLLFVPEPIHPGLLGGARLAVMHYDLITRHHPSAASRHIRLLYRWLQLPTLRRAHRVGVDSAHVLRETARLIPGLEDRAEVLPIHVDRPEPLAPPVAPKIEGIDKPFALYVGNLLPHKNVRRLLVAVEACGALPLVVVGRARPEVDDLRPELQRLAACGLVHHIGYASDGELEWLYRHAAFLAFPSLDEGYGLPILEAMSRGCPVMTSRGIATEEAAGGAALLVDPTNQQSISDGYALLATDAGQRSKLAAAGLAHARTHTRERHAGALGDFIARCLA
jgi:glycosyltransferase involved in cell wall biosynthesis